MHNHKVESIRKQLARINRRGQLSGRRVVIFGAAAVSLEIRRELADYGLRPEIVVDNDNRKIGRECMGLTVKKPEDGLLPFDDTLAIFLYSERYYREIILQLEQLGYVRDRHIFRLNEPRDESLNVFVRRLGAVVRGWFGYRRLMRKYPGYTLFVAPYTGTGDVYLSGLFFKEYVTRNDIDKYIFVVVSNACRKIAELFGIRNIEVLSGASVDAIIDCERVLRARWPMLILNDCWEEEHTNLCRWIRGYRGLDFAKMFRYFVFSFGDEIAYQVPAVAENTTAVDELFARYNLIKGRTVVLSPYSNTLFDVPEDVWARIAEHCRNMGFTVCTNSVGKDEPAVAGTEPVFFPLNLAREFMDAAGWFVGVRSGLCDIISASSCRKAVFYEKDGFFFKCSTLEYFGLKRMGLCDDALELEYRTDRRDGVVRQVLSFLSPGDEKAAH